MPHIDNRNNILASACTATSYDSCVFSEIHIHALLTVSIFCFMIWLQLSWSEYFSANMLWSIDDNYIISESCMFIRRMLFPISGKDIV